MPDYSAAKALEEKNIFRTKTIYRTGAGRMQWGEGIGRRSQGHEAGIGLITTVEKDRFVVHANAIIHLLNFDLIKHSQPKEMLKIIFLKLKSNVLRLRPQ